MSTSPYRRQQEADLVAAFDALRGSVPHTNGNVRLTRLLIGTADNGKDYRIIDPAYPEPAENTGSFEQHFPFGREWHTAVNLTAKLRFASRILGRVHLDETQ